MVETINRDAAIMLGAPSSFILIHLLFNFDLEVGTQSTTEVPHINLAHRHHHITSQNHQYFIVLPCQKEDGIPQVVASATCLAGYQSSS
jgi:hypothetical protein